MGELGVDAVQGHPQQHRELALEGSGVEDGEIGARGIDDAGPDALHETGPLEDLLGQGARRGVVGAEQGEARSGVARGDAGQELEVVLQDDGVHGLGGDVDHPRPRVAQADEEEEEALLVEVGSGELLELALVEGEGGDDHRGVGLLLAHGEDVPHLLEARLQPLELGDLLLEGEVLGEGRLGNHDAGAPLVFRVRTLRWRGPW